MFPFGAFTFWLAIASRTSSRLSPEPARAAGSIWTRTAGFCPPFRVTSPTPETWEIFCARIESAKSSTWSSGIVSLLTLRVRIGVSAGLLLLYVGGTGGRCGRGGLFVVWGGGGGSAGGRRLEAALIA